MAGDEATTMSRVSSRLASPAVIVGLVAALVVLWIVAIPPSAGPDEPSHITRGGALVRGELDGDRVALEAGMAAAFELPAEVAFPDPGCFAFNPEVPATCATSLPIPDGEAILYTRSADYPIWGHLLPGLGTLVPGPATGWASRLFDALVPAALLGAALVLASRRGILAASSTLLAVTPMAWFSFAVVNPSGYLIAGGIGLWVALVGLGSSSEPRVRSPRALAWLAGASWVALVLPRRDGLVYAALILALALLILDIDLRRIGRWPGAVASLATVVTLAWASRSDTNAALALFAAPFAPVGAVLVKRAWRNPAMQSRRRRAAASIGLAVVGTVGIVFVMGRRNDGFDTDALRTTVSQTGQNLRQAIGDLGWLDTPIPESALFLWLLALGVLVGAAIMVNARRLLIGVGAVIGSAVVVSWTLTMLQNDPLYWTGRYYLPLLSGAPILVGAVRLDAPTSRRLGLIVGSASLLVSVAALAQSMRRFGVGASGSLNPSDWNTYDSPLPPVVILLAAAVLSVALLAGLVRLSDERSVQSGSGAQRGVNVVGYHHVASGLGEIAREIHRSLVAAGVPCAVVDVHATDSPRLRDPEPVPAELYDTTIAVVAALQLPSVIHDLPELAAAHDRLVGYWFWELDTVPESHRLAIDTVDEIWTPTEFVRDAYAGAVGSSATPVRLVPTRIEEPHVAPADVVAWRDELTSGADDVLFLVSLDLFSVVERKNPIGVISAFRSAFPGGDEAVRLVVKTINGGQRPDDLARIVAAADGDPRISVLDRYVDEDELHALIAAADCYVSLHRSEGLGLHLASAMWVGTPVIATRWSGNLDFMDDDCAVLVDATLVPVTDGRGAYPESAHWADPDPEQAAAAMRDLASSAARRDAVAAAGRARMEAQPSRAEIGEAVWSTLRPESAGVAATTDERRRDATARDTVTP